VRYEVLAGIVAGPAAGPRYRITRHGSLLAEARTAEEAALVLRSHLDLDLAVHARTGLFVHAGAVAWRARGIALLGRTMTGQSTLVAELVRGDATYYSDEFAVLDDAGLLHPYARPLWLRGHPGPCRPVPPGELGGSVGRDPVPVALIVPTRYRQGAAWRPEVIRGSRAVLPRIANSILARQEPQRTPRVAARLAPTVVVLRGDRPEATSAAAAILCASPGVVSPQVLPGRRCRTGDEVEDPAVANRRAGLARRRRARRPAVARAIRLAPFSYPSVSVGVHGEVARASPAPSAARASCVVAPTVQC